MKREAFVALMVLGLAGCATAMRGGLGTTIEGEALEQILRKLPGVTGSTNIYLTDERYTMLTTGAMWEIYATIPPSLDAVGEGVWDCDKFARWAAINVDLQWAKVGGRLPIAQGVIMGEIPNDGDNRSTSMHALNWFVDNTGKFWLRGAQERSVFSQWTVNEMKNVTEIITG